MTDSTADKTWPERFNALRDLDGDAWDAENARLEEEWRAVYIAEFLRLAREHGWKEDDAQEWAMELVEESWINVVATPEKAAAIDIEAAESEHEA